MDSLGVTACAQHEVVLVKKRGRGDGLVIMPPIDHLPSLLGHRDTLLADWLNRQNYYPRVCGLKHNLACCTLRHLKPQGNRNQNGHTWTLVAATGNTY